MKLTPTQRDVLKKMAAGWTLREYTDFPRSCKIREPIGQYTSCVRLATFDALVKAGAVIGGLRHRFYTPYRLTEAGRAAAK